MSSSFSRRGFLKTAGTVALGVAATTDAAQAESRTAREAGRTVLPYPRTAIAKAKSLQVDQAVAFTFPDDASPCVLIKRAGPVAGGVGPDRSLIAYSTTCTHMGCPVVYQPKSATFKCPCHFTTFDAEREGKLICGQATENLPRIVLEYDTQTDSIHAVAVRGLLYGRQSNIL
jgi:arsenite oxidase small subunit